MDEFELIARFFSRASADPDVRVGVGDDGAVLRPPAGLDLVTVVDTLVEGVHYPADLPAADVGYRAVAVNLSDMAAMGSRPRWMTLALTLRESDAGWLEDFADGLYTSANECGVALVGGDTTRGTQVVVSVQITGSVEPGKALTRAGARPGDDILVTGSVGDAGAGLASFRQGAPRGDAVGYLLQRFARPTARVEAGRALIDVAASAIDLSDGLFTDLEKLVTASGVGAELDLDRLPLSPALRATAEPRMALQYALAGGDDYEICFTAAPAVIGSATEIAGVPISRIGRIVEGTGISCVKGGQPFVYHDKGYRHFN
jgi:thiamine-monophosphate kinase